MTMRKTLAFKKEDLLSRNVTQGEWDQYSRMSDELQIFLNKEWKKRDE